MIRLLPFIMGALGSCLAANPIETIHLQPAANMKRADLCYVKPEGAPCAVLVLAASWNSQGNVLITRKQWQEFAIKHNLGLVGLSFASEKEALLDGTGYYYASKGSGQLLLEGIERIYGKPLPLLLYGFSGGAQFTTRFVEWAPERVLGWCAAGAGWYDKPASNPASPPGIVSSGDEDLAYGPSIGYFMQGRKAGKPWLWLPLARTDHVIVPQLDEFVRKYFSVLLDQNPKKGAYADIHLRTLIDHDTDPVSPKRMGFLPDESLFDSWINAQLPALVKPVEYSAPPR